MHKLYSTVRDDEKEEVLSLLRAVDGDSSSPQRGFMPVRPRKGSHTS
jgi:hypothetical protein